MIQAQIQKDLPIGVFDSGLGGVSVLRELYGMMPSEKYIYYGDSANAPYGTKTHNEILDLTMRAAGRLVERGIKALVVACNTATSIAINDLREKYGALPVIGLEPALKPAAENSKGGKIIVMATPATLSEKKFAALFEKYRDEKDISLLPAPGLVEMVEEGRFGSPELYRLLEELLAPFVPSAVEAVVLGCTHYPFIKNEIKEVLGKDVLFYDGGHGAAAETKNRLCKMNLLADGGKDAAPFANVIFENSIMTKEILERSRMLFQR